METVCGCVCVTAVFLWVTLSRRSDPHTWSLSLSLSLYILRHSPSIPSLPVCLSVSVSPLFPVLCFKAEACVTHSTWHMKPLSCLEVAAAAERANGASAGGRRKKEGCVCVWTWGVDARNEVFVLFNCSKKNKQQKWMILLPMYAFRSHHKKVHSPLKPPFPDVICCDKMHSVCTHSPSAQRACLREH